MMGNVSNGSASFWAGMSISVHDDRRGSFAEVLAFPWTQKSFIFSVLKNTHASFARLSFQCDLEPPMWGEAIVFYSFHAKFALVENPLGGIPCHLTSRFVCLPHASETRWKET